MGGGGSYYDRDVSTLAKSSAGFTAYAQGEMSRSDLNIELLPRNRRLRSSCKSPLAYCFDITGSMKNLPVIIFDKMPMIAGQIVEQKYLTDVCISLSGIGDVTSDQGPLQVCDFSPVKGLDSWLKKIWREGQGGGQHYESYEFMAYYYARLYDMEKAGTPIFLFTGDESFRETMSGASLRACFGGEHQDVDSFQIFNELKAKFKGNVFLLHRYYDQYALDAEIVEQWGKALGKGYVVKLPDDKAVADMTLGIIALASGKRNLAGYIKDIRNRPTEMAGVKYKPQSEERINKVTAALKPLEEVLKAKGRGKKSRSDSSKVDSRNSQKKGGLKI